MTRIIPLILGVIAAVIGVDASEPNLWFAETAALAGVTAAAVAYLRQHVLKTLDGIAVVITSVGVGGLLGAAGHLAGFLTGTLPEALAFGVAAGWLASGGVDALRAVFGGKPQEG